MARLKIGSAARAVGVSKSTLSRAMLSGKVSYETDERGARWIEQSELLRAFPGASEPLQRSAPRTIQTRPDDALVQELRDRIQEQAQTIAALRAQVDRLLALVEQREQQRLPAPRSSGWWRPWRRPL